MDPVAGSGVRSAFRTAGSIKSGQQEFGLVLLHDQEDADESGCFHTDQTSSGCHGSALFRLILKKLELKSPHVSSVR